MAWRQLLSSRPNSVVLTTDRRVEVEIFFVREEHLFRVTDFEPTKQGLCALPSLLFHGVADNLSRDTMKRCEMKIFLSDTPYRSAADIELNSNFVDAGVLATLVFLWTNQLLDTWNVCRWVRSFRPTAARFAFRCRSRLIDTLTNFLHSAQLPVFNRIRRHYRLCTITLFTQCLYSHFVRNRYFTHDSSSNIQCYKPIVCKLLLLFYA